MACPGIMCIVPLMILFIIVIAAKEKKDIFKLFIEGALDGLKVVYNIFPYILAITISIGLLKSTGALDVILYPFKHLLVKFVIPEDIIPLCIMRPLSGGASMSVVMEIFKTSGADSISGKMASVIMGATEKLDFYSPIHYMYLEDIHYLYLLCMKAEFDFLSDHQYLIE